MAIRDAVVWLKQFRLKSLIVTDSMSVLQELLSLSLKKNEIVAQIINNLNDEIYLVWVPSHCGISGNIFVDEAAGRALFNRDNPDDSNQVTGSDYKVIKKNFLHEEKLKDWSTQVDNKFHKIYGRVDYPLAYNTNRKHQMIINRLRSGHCYLTHSYKMNKVDPPICDMCSNSLTVNHIFECTDNKTINLIRKWKINNWKVDIFDEQMLEGIIGFLVDLDYMNLI